MRTTNEPCQAGSDTSRKRTSNRATDISRTTSERSLTGVRLAVMAAAAGIGIANLYYNQPLLEEITAGLKTSEATTGLIPTLTQIGYALGMLFLVPLGDMFERRKLTLLFTFLSACIAFGTALSTSISVLLPFSLLLGLVNMGPQLLVPFAAEIASPERKGRVVGVILSGIFLGVLLSRTVAGFVGASFGWRAMFVLSGVVQLALLGALLQTLPKATASFQGTYSGLLRSVWVLLREQPVLREACLFGATLFAAFMVFWSSLIHLMVQPPFNLGPRAVGLYAVLGAGAAMLSPVVGRAADRGNARNVAGAMIALTIASFLIFWLGRTSILWIGVGVLAMDLGVQLCHVSNQSRILKLASGAQSRIQTAYMASYFGGGGAGAAIGSWAWSHWGWAGICLSSVVILTIPLIRWLVPQGR